ncbi:CGNR zinc finger domain-containing protein [Actinacidiphila yeochonensis]|uniref:CGNR zinc finger domain-containing protein n=1 Tax=Actinacidiphila yeochonensis TaxID=89050 RepID=UPI0005632D6D|nr:ABATE domain-containing protein [Actinacidiphila yeochonensis]
MRFDGGRRSLDLVAAGGGGPASDEDALWDPVALTGWLRAAGLVPAGVAVPATGEWPPRFAALRELVLRLVDGELAGLPADPRDVAALNGYARVAPPVPEAVCGGTGPADGGEGTGTGLRRGMAAPPTCDGLLSLLARDAVELLTDPAARERLRRCEGEGCGRVYVDTSRGHRRRWCSSEVCGNRERVARHRRRALLAG